MALIAMLAGMLLLIYAGAAYAGDEVASSSRMRQRSSFYAAVVGVLGGVLTLAGLAGLIL
jgi:hypothetical protein